MSDKLCHCYYEDEFRDYGMGDIKVGQNKVVCAFHQYVSGKPLCAETFAWAVTARLDPLLVKKYAEECIGKNKAKIDEMRAQVDREEQALADYLAKQDVNAQLVRQLTAEKDELERQIALKRAELSKYANV